MTTLDLGGAMTRQRLLVQRLFGLGIVSVGILTLVYGYGVLLFRPPPPAWVPWLKGVGYASGFLMLATGAGLVFQATARTAARILLPFLVIWTLSRVPEIALDPGREISWFAVGEVAVLAAAAVVLFGRLVQPAAGSLLDRVANGPGLRVAWILFGLSLVTYGLSHFFEFAARTISLVPAWLPYRTAWADVAGAGQIAAGLGVVFSILPRIAAAAEAAMLSAFTLLVWIPAVFAKPRSASNWVEFLFTFALAGASWVVAESIPPRRSETS